MPFTFLALFPLKRKGPTGPNLQRFTVPPVTYYVISLADLPKSTIILYNII